MVNDTLFNLILNNESAFMAVTNVARGVQVIVNSTKALEIIASQINNISNNEIVIKAILENPELFNSILNNEAIVTSISNSEVGIKAILRNLDGFKALINNQTALTTALKSQITVNAITKAMEECLNAEVILDTTKNNLNVIKENLPKLVDGMYISDDVINTQASITATKDKIVGVTSKTDVLIANVNGLVNSATAMAVIANNATALKAVLNNQDAKTLILKSPSALNSLYSDMVNSSQEFSTMLSADEYVNVILKNLNIDMSNSLKNVAVVNNILRRVDGGLEKVCSSKLNANMFVKTVLSDKELCWTLNSKNVCGNKSNFAITFNTTKATYTNKNGISDTCKKIVTNPTKGAYFVTGTGEIYQQDKIEICKLASGVYTGIGNVYSYSGYYSSNKNPSVLIENASRVVFCYGTETIWHHADNSAETTANLYCTEIK